MLVALLAFGWALASASFLFVAADVLVSLIAIRQHWKMATTAIIAAVAGTLLGAVLIYLWAASAPDSATAFLASQPDITSKFILDNRLAMLADWPIALLKNLMALHATRVPALEAGTLGIPLFRFVLVAGAVMALRLVAVALLAGLAGRLLSGRLSANLTSFLLIFGWVVFYAVRLVG